MRSNFIFADHFSCRSPPPRISAIRRNKEKRLQWRFGAYCLLAGEAITQVHRFSALTGSLPSAKKIPSQFFLEARFASFRSTVATRSFSRDSVGGR